VIVTRARRTPINQTLHGQHSKLTSKMVHSASSVWLAKFFPWHLMGLGDPGAQRPRFAESPRSYATDPIIWQTGFDTYPDATGHSRTKATAHPVERSGALQQSTCALAVNAKQCQCHIVNSCPQSKLEGISAIALS